MNKVIFLSVLCFCTPFIMAQKFERVSNIDMKGGYLGLASWCDYNSDGLLDVFVTGVDFDEDFKHAEIYKNNGNKTFSLVEITNIPRTIYGDLDWGDYDNNGTLDLIYAGTRSGFCDKNVTKIYKNVENGKFVEITHTIPKLQSCSVNWVDIDNDGLLDVYYQGINSNNEFDLGVFKNMGDDLFQKVDVSFEIIRGGRGNFTQNTAKWADFDYDGLKDVLMAKSTGEEYSFEFYKNFGDFRFQKVDIGLPQINNVEITIGDYNQDGLMDFVFLGNNDDFLSSNDYYADAYIFINTGQLTFDKSNEIANIGVFMNTLESGDIDNDGYLDIVYYGYEGLKIYRNNQDNTFTRQNHSVITAKSGGAAVGDFDNDQDLDLLYYGRIDKENDIEVTYVYENKLSVVNNKPQAPQNISIYAFNNDLLFNWDQGKDDLTHPNGLYYNLCVGTKSEPYKLVSSYSIDGKLKNVHLGNMMKKGTYLYKDFPSGNYSFKVQSIDNSYSASPFSEGYDFCFKQTSNLLGDTVFFNKGDSVLLELNDDYVKYKWNTGVENPGIYAKREGVYNVNVWDQEGCQSSETVYVKMKEVISTSDHSSFKGSPEFRVYPIPLRDEFTIECNRVLKGITDIRIVDVNGKCVFQESLLQFEKNHKIFLSNLSKGVYFLSVQNSYVSSFKVIKLVKY